MGGFLAASYAIKYPQHVRHLILADPWGFPEKPKDVVNKSQVPFWVKAIAYLVQPLNPLWAVRFAGPYGKYHSCEKPQGAGASLIVYYNDFSKFHKINWYFRTMVNRNNKARHSQKILTSL